MTCGRCEPDYCACADFFGSYLSFHRGEIDRVLAPSPAPVPAPPPVPSPEPGE